MGQAIWGLLKEYEGRWVAVDKTGKVLAHADELEAVMREARALGAATCTYLFASKS